MLKSKRAGTGITLLPEDKNQIISGEGSSHKRGFAGVWQQLLTRRPGSKLQLGVVVSAFAVLGVITLIFSLADTVDLTTSKSANDVIVQYSLPHQEEAASLTNLDLSTPPPFTLYGNGLLICGHDNPAPFDIASKLDTPDTLVSSLPTSAILSPAEIHKLVKQVSDTGFLNLDKEYYKAPVSEKQDVVRVTLASSDHYVMYYNDVPAPAAYTQTLAILQTYCQGATTPYQPNNVVLRTLKNANPKSNAIKQSTTVDTSIAPTIQQAIGAADTASSQARAPVSSDQSSVSLPGEADQQLSGAAAKATVQSFSNSPKQYIRAHDATYEVGVDVPIPKVNNPLNVNYAAIRQKKAQSGLGAKIRSLISPPKVYAAGSIPVRLVILLPSDGGATDRVSEAQTLAPAVHNWYCGQVGSCYSVKEVNIMRGSQTQAYYMTCHAPDPCANNPLLSVIYNVFERDQGTIYRSDVDTVVVTGWPTGALNSNVCGYAFVGQNLAAVDLYEPTIAAHTGNFCQPGHDIAHESGHTFGLNHTGDGTLMDGNPFVQYSPFCDIANSGEPVCTLDPGQAASLRSNPMFVTQPSWSNWESLGGVLTSSPDVTAWSPNRLDVAVRGGSNIFYHKAYAGPEIGGTGWYPWDNGKLFATTSGPAIASWQQGRLDIFSRGTNNHLWHMAFVDPSIGGIGWYPWDDLGGNITSDPTAVSWSRGRIDVFARGTDNAVWHRAYMDPSIGGRGWNPWDSVGGVVISSPAVTSWKPGRLDLFAQGTNGALFHKAYIDPAIGGTGWYPWDSPGGTITSGPAVASWQSGRLDVFARGTDNALWHKAYVDPTIGGTGWYPWDSLGGVVTSDPGAVSWTKGRIDVFVRGTDNALYHKFYQ